MTRNATLLACTLFAGACTTTVVRSAPNPVAAHLAHAQVAASGDVVSRGTRFDVRLDRTIDTERSHVGDGFTAYTTAPLVARDGRVVAPAGAPIVGHVAQLEEGRAPTIVLCFDAIQTERGYQPLQVRVVSTERAVYTDHAVRVAMYPTPMYLDEEVFGPAFTAPFMNSFGPQGGGPVGREYVGHPREAHLPSGSIMRLDLTQPLIVPE